MKKYKYLIMLLAFIFIPNVVNAEVIGITQQDCITACMTNQKVKGITCNGGFYFDSGEYRLDSDFESDDVSLYVSGTNVSLDLNGHDITGAAIYVNGGGSLEISGDGQVTNNNGYIFDVYDGSSLTINNGTYTSNNRVIHLDGEDSSVTINDGSFTSEGQEAIEAYRGGSLTINGGSFSASYYSLGAFYIDNIEINGGTFEGFIGAFINTYNSLSINGGTFRGGAFGIIVGIDDMLSNSSSYSHETHLSGGSYSGEYDEKYELYYQMFQDENFQPSSIGYYSDNNINIPSSTFSNYLNSLLGEGYTFENEVEFTRLFSESSGECVVYETEEVFVEDDENGSYYCATPEGYSEAPFGHEVEQFFYSEEDEGGYYYCLHHDEEFGDSYESASFTESTEEGEYYCHDYDSGEYYQVFYGTCVEHSEGVFIEGEGDDGYCTEDGEFVNGYCDGEEADGECYGEWIEPYCTSGDLLWGHYEEGECIDIDDEEGSEPYCNSGSLIHGYFYCGLIARGHFSNEYVDEYYCDEGDLLHGYEDEQETDECLEYAEEYMTMYYMPYSNSVVPVEYTITTSATNGTITQSSDEVEHGSNFTVTYSANSGYALKSVTVDNNTVNRETYAEAYTFSNVTSDHTISVVYVEDNNNNNVPDDEEYLITTSATNGTITESTYVYQNDNFTVNYSANSGYVLKSVTVDGSEVDKGTYSSSYTFSNVTSTHEISVVYEEESNTDPEEDNYEIIEGDNQKFKDEDIVITCNGDYNLFVKLLVDGEEVDEENYTVESGSTIVTLKKSYLDTLGSGKHTITFVYQDGQASATLNVPMTNVPKTLDNIYSYILLLIASFAMLIIGIKVIKKK